MDRQPNTQADGSEWTEETRKAVWQKATDLEQMKPEFLKYDTCGYLIHHDEFGKRDKSLGWEIDHIVPVKYGGTDDLFNLQPLNWRNNDRKANQTDWKCEK